MVYKVEIVINGETYLGEMEIFPTLYSPFSSLETDFHNLPVIEGMGRYPSRFKDGWNPSDTKHNLHHNSTRSRLIHREGRLAKLSQK